MRIVHLNNSFHRPNAPDKCRNPRRPGLRYERQTGLNPDNRADHGRDDPLAHPVQCKPCSSLNPYSTRFSIIEKDFCMKTVSHDSLLFALTHPYEVSAMKELRDYFDCMYFAN